jgi:hypothetical protein
VILHLVAAVGLQTLLAGVSPAAPRVYVDAGPAALAAEQRVTIRWSGLPADARELELLLDLDGGRARLRITDELDPRAGSYAWDVASVSARAARIVLRMNRGGREVEIAPSEPFAIVNAAGPPRAALSLRAGEMWLTDDDEEGDCDPPEPAPALAGAPATIRAREAVVPLALPDPSFLPGPDASPRTALSARVAASVRPLPDDRPCLLVYPRRI